MAWTAPMTASANGTLTAAQFNTHVRDNLLETETAKATAAVTETPITTVVTVKVKKKKHYSYHRHRCGYRRRGSNW